MKKLTLFVGVVLLAAATASANPSCVALVGMPVANCSAGGLSFSNFQITGFGVANPRVFLGSIEAGTNSLTLAFNPMLGLPGNARGLWIRYSVASDRGPAITGAGVANGGNPGSGRAASSAAEWICKDDDAGPGGCGSFAATLAYLQASGGEKDSATWSAAARAVSVFQELEGPERGSMTGFTHSFKTNDDMPTASDIPEPMTFTLIGGGLVMLGILRRRSRG